MYWLLDLDIFKSYLFSMFLLLHLSKGHTSFRPHQRSIVQAVGAGKSVDYMPWGWNNPSLGGSSGCLNYINLIFGSIPLKNLVFVEDV